MPPWVRLSQTTESGVAILLVTQHTENGSVFPLEGPLGVLSPLSSFASGDAKVKMG